MNLSAPFINRPIATSLLAIGLALAGILSFCLLPVSSLPQVEFPTILVQASLPGASPEIMATSVATPLERSLSRIAGITDMTSSSSLGSTKIILQFDLNRDINGAARDVQAALNAASANLPSNLPTTPSYRKVNPADSPIMVLALTSEHYKVENMYDVASTIIQQKLLQVEGVGQVNIAGSSLPAVRIEINPTKLTHYGVSLNQISQLIKASNLNLAKGTITDNDLIYNIIVNDQIFKAEEYQNLVIRNNNGNLLKLRDVAKVTDSVQDIRNAGLLNGEAAVLLVLYKAPGANVIETNKKIRTAFAAMKSVIPAAMEMHVVMDRTNTIEASLKDVEKTLVTSMIFVVIVVYLFLGNIRAMIIPGVAMALSLLGTFVIMWLLGFSLNILSLMALTISTGFVVDDAIVVLENISRYIEKGMKPIEASLKGAKEIGFTVASITISLIAVFIPILLMGGIVGRLFREFAVSLSIAIIISLFVSLTLTPTMCAYLLKAAKSTQEKLTFSDRLKNHYELGLRWALNHQKIMLLITILTIVSNIFLFIISSKGFFPQQDTERIIGNIITDQNSSFQSLKNKFTTYVKLAKEDPAIENVVGFIGSGSVNTGTIFMTLKPLKSRKISADIVVNRLRKKLSAIPGSTLYMQVAQDLVIGGRQGNAQFQYTISGDSIAEVNQYAPIIAKELAKIPGIVDVNSDQGNHGLQSYIDVNYSKAAQYGITAKQIDNILYSAFGQASISTIYTPINQYYVVMGLANQYTQNPQNLEHIYIPSNNGKLIPLSYFSKFNTSPTLLSVNHQGLSPSATLSFNLLPNVHLGDIVNMVNDALNKLTLPITVQGSFRGTAQAFQSSLANEGILILAALVAVYLVLGMLYESLLHPITILSTLPSAGVGALLALSITNTDLTIIALIGIILLIGIVKKNAIMMIDFVLEIKKQQNISSYDAIYQAALLRFRPIMMTSMAALLGAIPMAFGTGLGSEMQKPLGIAIIGGLIMSQMLTLFTTPVVFLAIDRLKTK